MAKEFPIGTIREWESGTVIKAHDPIKPYSNGWINLQINPSLNSAGVECDNIAAKILRFKEPIDGELFLDHEIENFVDEQGNNPFKPDDFKQYYGFYGSGRYAFRNEFSKRFMNDKMTLSEKINQALVDENEILGGDDQNDKLTQIQKKEIRDKVKREFKESENKFTIEDAQKLNKILQSTLEKVEEGVNFKDLKLKEIYDNFKKVSDSLPESYFNIRDKRKLKNENVAIIEEIFKDNWGVLESSKKYIDKKFTEYVKKYVQEISKDNLSEQLELFGVDMNMEPDEFYEKIYKKLGELSFEDKDFYKDSFKDLVYLRFIHKYNKSVEGDWSFEHIPAIHNLENLINDLPDGHFKTNGYLENITNKDYNGGNNGGYAWYNGGERRINLSSDCISKGSVFGQLMNPTEFKSVLLHEVGHAVSQKLGRSDFYDYKKFVVECGWTYTSPDLRYDRHATGSDKKIERTGSNSHITLMTDYSKVSPEEAFAEYYSFYNLNKENLDRFFKTGHRDYLEKYSKTICDSIPSERSIGELLRHKVLALDDVKFKEFRKIKEDLSDRGNDIVLSLISPWILNLSREAKANLEPQKIRNIKDRSIHSMPPIVTIKGFNTVIDGASRIESAKLNKKLCPSIDVSKEMYLKLKENNFTDDEISKCVVTEVQNRHTDKQIAPQIKLKGLKYRDEFVDSNTILQNFNGLLQMKKICESEVLQKALDDLFEKADKSNLHKEIHQDKNGYLVNKWVSNSTLGYLNQLRNLTSGKQRGYYDELLSKAKEVKIYKTQDVLSKDEIKQVLKNNLQQKECYKNAATVCLNIEGCNYIEGQVLLMNQIPIEHAFNERNGKYFDFTSDFVLKGKSLMSDYVSYLELNERDLVQYMQETEIYGPYFTEYFKKSKIK